MNKVISHSYGCWKTNNLFVKDGNDKSWAIWICMKRVPNDRRNMFIEACSEHFEKDSYQINFSSNQNLFSFTYIELRLLKEEHDYMKFIYPLFDDVLK